MRHPFKLLAVCAILAATSSCTRRQPVIIEEIEPVEIGSGLSDWIATEEAQAETVVVVEILISRQQAHISRFPLVRNPSATLRGLSFINTNWCSCGGRGGNGGSIDLSGHENERDPVDVSFRASAGEQYLSVQGKVAVPWQGKVETELGNGVTVRAYFEKPQLNQGFWAK